MNNTVGKEDLEYVVGDKVPYINTASKMCWAEITSFKIIERNNKRWFYGVDTKTKAEVFYPSHLSKNYFDAMQEFGNQLVGDKDREIETWKGMYKSATDQYSQLQSQLSTKDEEIEYLLQWRDDLVNKLANENKRCVELQQQLLSAKSEIEEKDSEMNVWRRNHEEAVKELNNAVNRIIIIRGAIRRFNITDIDAPIFTHTQQFGEHFDYIKEQILNLLELYEQ